MDSDVRPAEGLSERAISDVTIRDIRVIFTEPDDIRLVVVKVETSDQGLHGVGCATSIQRPTAVKAAVDDYLRPSPSGQDGCPEVRDGYMWPNCKPGLGTDVDERLATKYLFREYEFGGGWDTLRRADGSAIRP